MSQLDEAGLRGPPDGKVAVAYEFVIPDTATHRAEVSAVDPTVQYDHQDWYWGRGRVDLGTNQGVARFHRDGAVVVTFDWEKEVTRKQHSTLSNESP